MKTRAFDPETKQWRTDYVVTPDGEISMMTAGKDFFIDQSINLIRQPDWKLSRFTGLVDLKDTEVYEHHILADENDKKYVVIWDQESCMFKLKQPWIKNILKRAFYYPLDDHIVTYMTVVGDVFLNSELLEV